MLLDCLSMYWLMPQIQSSYLLFLSISSTLKRPMNMIVYLGTFSWLFLRAWAFLGSGRGRCICIFGIHFLVLVNGEATVMETLSRLIIKANKVGFLEGIHINVCHSEDVLISHLLSLMILDRLQAWWKPFWIFWGVSLCFSKWCQGSILIYLTKLTYLKVFSFPLVSARA